MSKATVSCSHSTVLFAGVGEWQHGEKLGASTGWLFHTSQFNVSEQISLLVKSDQLPLYV